MITIFSGISGPFKGLSKPLIRPIPWFFLIIRLALGLVFVYAGLTKLSDPKAFARIISQYELIPDPILPVAAIGLPVLELVAGIGVILALRGSLNLIFSLLVFFAVVLWYGILKNLNVDCGCFSLEELKSQAGLWQAFYRDLIMMGGVILLYSSRWLQFDRRTPWPLWAMKKPGDRHEARGERQTRSGKNANPWPLARYLLPGLFHQKLKEEFERCLLKRLERLGYCPESLFWVWRLMASPPGAARSWTRRRLP